MHLAHLISVDPGPVATSDPSAEGIGTLPSAFRPMDSARVGIDFHQRVGAVLGTLGVAASAALDHDGLPSDYTLLGGHIHAADSHRFQRL